MFIPKLTIYLSILLEKNKHEVQSIIFFQLR